MAPVIFLDDAADPRLADYRALTDVELRRRSEPADGIFIAEGEHVMRRAARAGYPIRSALTSDRWLPTVLDLTEGTNVPVYVGTSELLYEITGFHVHRGALAAMARRPPLAVESVLADARRVVVLEGINSHTNMGAIFRCAAGLGMDAVLLTPECADPLYRRSVRVSMGEVFALPYARLASWSSALDSLADFALIGLTPDAAAQSLGDLDFADDAKIALFLGSEGFGLSETALAVTRPVRIPMSNGVDSLNVAAAAAVACYALRRRA